MTSYILSIKNFLLVCSAAFLFSCDKVEVAKDAGEAGQAIVKIVTTDSAFSSTAIDAAVTPQIANLLEIRRDIANKSQLNSTMNVVLVEDQAIVDAYNDKFHTDYEALPTGSYSVSNANPRNGNNWTVTFNPGEFVKYLQITIPNAANLDLSKTYAFGFRLQSADGDSKITGTPSRRTSIAEIIIRNIYDGNYRSVGFFAHPTPTSSRAFDRPKTLLTVGATTVRTELGDLGGSGYEMTLTVNPDNTVTITGYLNGAPLPVNQSWGPNYYDPATRSFHLHYSYNTTAPRIIEEVITRR